MFNQPIYNPQASVDRINNQIAELERLKAQLPQQPMGQPITQNFQLAPANNSIRYAENIEEVQKDFVIGDTPYFSKDMSVVWVKNTKGEITTYQLQELIVKDDKDLMIESLQTQIEELKKGIVYESNNADNVIKSTKSKEPSNVSNVRTSKK